MSSMINSHRIETVLRQQDFLPRGGASVRYSIAEKKRVWWELRGGAQKSSNHLRGAMDKSERDGAQAGEEKVSLVIQ